MSPHGPGEAGLGQIGGLGVQQQPGCEQACRAVPSLPRWFAGELRVMTDPPKAGTVGGFGGLWCAVGVDGIGAQSLQSALRECSVEDR